MSIRRATLNDIEAIQQVANETWPITFESILSPVQIDYMLNWMYNSEILGKTIQLENNVFWLYEIENKVVAFTGIEHNYQSEAITRIHKIYVSPEAQGQKIGLKLIQHIEQEALKHNSSRLNLNVNRFNNAVKFYEHIGFQIIDEENIDIGNGFLMEDYVMEKVIE